MATKSAPTVGTIPEKKLHMGYDWGMMLAKILLGSTFGVGWWLIMQYVMEPASFTGLNFLNQAGHTVEYKRKAVQEQLSKLDADTVSRLISVLNSQ